MNARGNIAAPNYFVVMVPDKKAVTALCALNSVHGLGPVRIKALVDHYGSAVRLFEREGRAALVQAAAAFSGEAVDPQAVFDAAARRLEEAEALGITVLTWGHDSYPPLLREIYAPPPVLFIKGKLDVFTRNACAVVGTRRATQYGKSAASFIVKQLVEKRVTVVSGLALGIDTVAHKACLDAGGETIAVLGCGLDTVYPAANRELAQRIAESGALVSEFDLGESPEAYHFPRRNRIISGLSAGVLVVEAPERSGSLITAGFALQQGRDVFAITGSIFSNASVGTFNLIKNGAIPVCSAQDIIDNMTHLSMAGVADVHAQGRDAPSPALDLLSPDEQRVADALSAEPLRLDAIAEKTERAVSQLFDILLNLELKGVIRQVAGQQYVRAE